MATTPRGIYYPTNYGEAADVPEAIRLNAESADDALDALSSTLTTALSPKANPTFTGNVVIPNADATNEAMALGQLPKYVTQKGTFTLGDRVEIGNGYWYRIASVTFGQAFTVAPAVVVMISSSTVPFGPYSGHTVKSIAMSGGAGTGVAQAMDLSTTGFIAYLQAPDDSYPQWDLISYSYLAISTLS